MTFSKHPRRPDEVARTPDFPDNAWPTQAICRRLRSYSFRAITEPANLPRAAVALVLRDGEHGSEFVAIHRAHRDGDPWSGHVALPGGRQQPGDANLIVTAVRETREEIGIDLAQVAEVVTELDELRAIGRGRVLDLVIRPVVFVLRAPVVLQPSPKEVQKALWVPLAVLRHPYNLQRHSPVGAEFPHPAFEFQGYTIWGLTHRILTQFVSLLSGLDAGEESQNRTAEMDEGS